ncbi:hypothetical protein MKUB_49970 [Mycobacterium kubicae]|uniref:Phasin family protein n=1 Tax=Mycobacterium kubicae TaxID=120959 RepID=A0AAX1J7J8_9MYCO|nr:hypothetical protein [Mycobacterium kubicae]MCV7094676.1 hypothetical protein [Mycobacterium kubicae]QNI07957.1 hypothetical protein GAN17_18055 [Mycobacterium kubicae]QNI13016.1 hypothetical protein GAN18_19195 [Mycobacterium kubicae]QPI36532.1 hypothetical protein I2456_18885 [Mycobacterium kubicae]GFG67507.1 hypothetical protein MKUB_49970 [Mycobacterium kubicae]
MSVEEPPSLGSLSDSTRQLQQWGREVPQDILKVNHGALNRWFLAAGQLVDAVNLQVAAASNLRINEGVVGSFQSARVTARNLNESADAIRQRLAEYAAFATALQEFSRAAYSAIQNADR